MNVREVKPETATYRRTQMSAPVTLRTTWLCHLLVSEARPMTTTIKLDDHLDWITNGPVLRAPLGVLGGCRWPAGPWRLHARRS